MAAGNNAMLNRTHCKSSIVWCKEQTVKLISEWKEDAINAIMEVCWHNKKCIEKITKQTYAAGYTKSAEQYSNKIKKLNYSYRVKSWKMEREKKKD